MKKVNLFFLLLILISLSGCKFFKTETITYENEVKLTIKEDYIKYLGYNEEDIPTYTFNFLGKLNFALRTTGPNEIVFTNNNDFVVSDIISEFLKYHEENGIISYRSLGVTKKYETHLNKKVVDDKGNEKSERVYLKVIDGNMYNEIAYITLDNGLQLTMNFRRFLVSDDLGNTKTYYAWQYSESIRMILYYPLMVVENSKNERKILIVALPNGVINKIESRLDVEGLMSKDTYLDSSYYTYPYPDYDAELSGSSYDNSSAIASIKKYYQENFSTKEKDDLFIFTYLGYDFSVKFNKTDFTISYVE